MPVPTPNSSTGGYLVPDALAPPPYPPPLEGAALDDVFHDVICGILGFDVDSAHKQLVRPRFQMEPPNEPDIGTDWVSFGLTTGKRDFDRVEIHSPNYYGPDAGATITMQDQEVELFVSYYGSDAAALQGQFEDGIKVAQNRDALDALQIKFMYARDAYRLPALFKDTRWRERWDQKFVFRRRVYRVYPILNIASASVHSLDNEQYLTNIDVNPPPP